MLSNVLNAGKDIANRIGNTIMNLSEVEAKIKEATNDDPWGPHAALMQEIAEESFSSMNFNEIMNFLWYRIFTERPLNGRRTYKGLLLLTYMLLNGSDYVILRSKDYIEEIRRLETYSDVTGAHVASIRKKAADVYDLLTNSQRLQGEREKAKNNQMKVYSKKFSVDSIGSERQQSSNTTTPKLGDFDSWQPRSKSIPVVIGESFINLVNTLTQNISGPPPTETHDNFDLPSLYEPATLTNKSKNTPAVQNVKHISTYRKDTCKVIHDSTSDIKKEVVDAEIIDQEIPIIDFSESVSADHARGLDDDFGDFHAWNSPSIVALDRPSSGDFFPDFDNLDRSISQSVPRGPTSFDRSDKGPQRPDAMEPRPEAKLGSTWTDLGSLKIDLENVCGARRPMYSKS